MISVPLRKDLEFVTTPVIDPSAFWVNLLRTGMLSATGAAFFGAAALGAPPKENPKDCLGAAAFGLTGSGVGSGFFAGLDPPKRENVGLFCTGLATSGLAATLALAGAAFFGEEKVNVGDFFAAGLGSTGAGTGDGLGLGPPKMLNVGAFLTGAGLGAGVAAFFGVEEEMEKVPGPLTGVAALGSGAAAFFGGADEKKPNELDALAAGGFFSTTGAGAGGVDGLGADPPNKLNVPDP